MTTLRSHAVGTIFAMDHHGEPAPGRRYGPPTTPPPAPTEDHPRGGRVPAAVWPIPVLVVALFVGAAVGLAVTALGTAGSDDDGWGELGAFILGAVLGFWAFVVAYLGGLVFAVWRVFPRGLRALPLTLSLAVPAVLAAMSVTVNMLMEAQAVDFPRATGMVAFLGAAAAAPAAFAWSRTTNGRRRLALGTAAVLALMVVTTGAHVAVARQQLAAVADRMPFVLFAGGSADAPFDGWRRDRFTTITITDDLRSIAPGGHRAYLKYLTPGTVVFVTMHTDIGPCDDTAAYTCRVTGAVAGNELRRYERTTSVGIYPRSEAFDVIAYPDGSAVSVSDEEPRNWPPETRTATRPALASLVRVDRHQFERATGSSLRLG